MPSDLIIFGADRFASLAWYCVTHDSPYRVVAFTVDRAFVPSDKHEGLPVLPFDELTQHFAPGEVRMLIALGYRDINGLRRARYESAKKLGYELAGYVSTRASTWPDFSVGDNCIVYEHAVIQPFSRIGCNVIIRSAAHISHHCTLEDHSFVSAGVTFGGSVTVGEQAFIGVGATIRDGVHIGARCLIGAGAVVLHDTEPDGVYVGNPAKRISKTAAEATGGRAALAGSVERKELRE